MKKQIGPIRVATWRHAWQEGVRGMAVSWNTRRILLSWEFHYEKRKS